MIINKVHRMLSILEEEILALIEVVVKVNPQEAMAFNVRLKEKMQKLQEEYEEMEEMELAQNAEIKSLIKEHKELMAKREAVLLEREAEVAAREMMLYVKDSAQRTLGVGSIAQA